MDQLFSSIVALTLAVFILQELPKLAGSKINAQGVIKTVGMILLKTALVPLVILRALLLWLAGAYGRNCLHTNCPNGHEVALWEEVECDHCHFLSRRSLFGRCQNCGQQEDHIPCPNCNHSIMRPGRWLERLLHGSP